MTTIAIIGTAGRGEDGDRLNLDVYTKMYRKAKELVDEIEPVFENQHLVSGGAAYADHLAVLLAKNFGYPLTLHLPAEIRMDYYAEVAEFLIQKSSQFPNPASTANYYHKKFSEKIYSYSMTKLQTGKPRTSFHDLFVVLMAGARTTISDGFHARNLLVAQSDVIIAFTFGEGDVPKDGGTKHTWDHAQTDRKIHVPIGSL